VPSPGKEHPQETVCAEAARVSQKNGSQAENGSQVEKWLEIDNC
jgi:hypothetical protein